MKKLLAVLLVIVMMIGVSPCVACAEDYSAKSDAELFEALNAIRAELVQRGYKAENKKVILDEGGIQIYINGDYSVVDDWYGLALNVPIVIVNQTSQNICVQLRDASVNGWACETMFSSDIPAGKKIKDTMEFMLEDTDVTNLSEFEDAEFIFHVFDNDSWDGVVDTDIIHLVA